MQSNESEVKTMLNPTTKKLTKAQIYARHGIIYKGGKIETPIGWMNELLKVGGSYEYV